MSWAEILACPMDGLALETKGRALICSSGHNYDIARNGYCNLLLVQQKASRDPGDSNEMVAARRRFLNAGHYATIADRVYFMANTFLRDDSLTPVHVVDAGCGEGYYLERFAACAREHERPTALALVGWDVSKWAVKAAATRDVQSIWLVASNRQPPLLQRSVDLILCLFGFPNWNGFARVLAEGGHVLLADPGPEHLIELRRIIYPTVRTSPPPALDAAQQAGFELEAEETVSYSIDIEGAQMIQDLLLMTPHGVRMASERRTDVAKLERLTVTVDVQLRLLAKRS